MSSEQRQDPFFYITGIQDGFKTVMWAAHGGANGYLKALEVYGGPRDDEAIRAFVAQNVPSFPAGLVVFGDAVKKLDPATAPVGGEPRTYRVDCSFTYICCDDNVRGEVERQRGDAGSPGVIRMFSDASETLSGLYLARRGDATVAVPPGEEPAEGDVLLTDGPLTPTADRILEVPGLTCYGSDFETYFHWTERDRRDEEVGVTEVDLTVNASDREAQPGRLPGVIIE